MKSHHWRLGGDTRALGRFLGLGRGQLYRRYHRLKVRLRGGRGRGKRDRS